jgi:hypothetical protein
MYKQYSEDLEPTPYTPIDLKNIKQLNLMSTSLLYPGPKGGCAIDLNSDLYCWGYNEYGEVGNGTYSSTQNGEVLINGFLTYPTFEVFKVMENVQSIYRRNIRVAGSPPTMCAVTTQKELYCWGENPRGDSYQVDFGDNILKSSTPILIKNDVIGFNELNTYYLNYDSFISESDNLSANCVLYNQRFDCIDEDNVQKAIETESSGRFFIDGNSNLATIGNGKSIISYEKYQDIALADENTICVIDFSGDVFCMLENSSEGNLFGQGNEGIAYSDELIKIPNISNALSFPEVMSSTISGDLCVLTNEKQVLCWGDEFDGIHTFQP